ncbi:MAG: LPS assembly lipoprotein LptE [Planctomycetaceae bacterium]
MHLLIAPRTILESALTCMSICLVLCQAGCAAYQFGSRSMFPEHVRTVYVPIARNDTFRHDLGVRLNEAVVRQIELQTPYKVKGDPNADSTLTIRFSSETKRVLTESVTDDPRALDAIVIAQASWVDRSGASLMQNRVTVSSNLATEFLQSDRFVPEAGQSVETALQSSIDDLAERIVSQMENRW